MANPVFFIGADQAKAAAELAAVEERMVGLSAARKAAEDVYKSAAKVFAEFKRDRAKLTASRLHLSGRKYEAPALAKDHETWAADGVTLTDAELDAAEATRRAAEPMPPLFPLQFEASNISTAYRFITDACGKSLGMVALEEVERFPDMLLWLKQGREFHEANGLEDCLFCGNVISVERRSQLASALDGQVDAFITRLARTADRLNNVFSELGLLQNSVPATEVLAPELRIAFSELRREVIKRVERARDHLESLERVLARKRANPAAPADVSGLAPQSEAAETAVALARAIDAANASIRAHNELVGNFATHRNDAEVAIRKHFVADCHADYANHMKDLGDAGGKLTGLGQEIAQALDTATRLRQQVKEHGPAAAAINKLIASYLGHAELTIHPVDRGYELHRHDTPIRGVPSEGEKTAIAISYFLSSLEAEGRKLKDMIVVIDDPVSSLDTKALNYACSLVRSRLGDAGQVFIMTHNLQCMNEFRKAWKKWARPPTGKDPSAALLFIDVAIPVGEARRSSRIVEMPRLLREYDSEYHFLFSHVLKFVDEPDTHYGHAYMMPNVLRRVLDVFLAFKCPGSSGITGQIAQLCADHPHLDRDRLTALERLAQVESHSDNLDDLLSFSSMTLEEARAAAGTLLDVMHQVDAKHLASLRYLCR